MLQDNGSLTIEALKERSRESSWGFSEPNRSMMGEIPQSVGDGFTTFNDASSRGGDGLSINFLASTSWTGFVAGSKKSYSLINNEVMRQTLYNNSIRRPGMPLDEVTSLKVPKGIKIIGKYGGLAFTLHGAYDINKQWSNSEISTSSMIVEQVSNVIGAIPVYGTAWSIGWNLGKACGPSTWYGDNDYKYFE